jgi:hypothetical protein
MIYLKALVLLMLLVLSLPGVALCTACLFIAQRIMK